MQNTCVYQPSSETIHNYPLIQKEIRLRFIMFQIRNSGLSSTELTPKLTNLIDQCFSTAGPRPGTGPWPQLYRAVRDSPGIDN